MAVINQMAVIGKKAPTIVKGSWEWNPTWVNHNTEKKQSCLILLVQPLSKAYIFKANLHIIPGK